MTDLRFDNRDMKKPYSLLRISRLAPKGPRWYSYNPSETGCAPGTGGHEKNGQVCPGRMREMRKVTY